MAETIRRILWLLPALAAGAILVFLGLGSINTVKARLSRPLFYNSQPQSAEIAAQSAIRALLEGSAKGQEQLIELGGAGLPTVLSALPTMNISDQRQVAAALWPIAERMGTDQFRAWRPGGGPSRSRDGSPTASQSADEQLLFWERYRDEHAVDLRALSTSRLVRRLAGRGGTLLNADLLAIDTYALPTLVNSLGRIASDEDIDRCRRLVGMISHVTGGPWSVPPGATREQTRQITTEIRRFWDKKGAQWTQLDSLSLLVARFSQTEFTAWVLRTTRQFSAQDHPKTLEAVRPRLRVSLALLSSCLVGFLLVGPIVAASVQIFQLRKSQKQVQDLAVRLSLTIILMTAIASVLSSSSGGLTQATLASLTVGSLLSAFALHREVSDRLDWRSRHVLQTRTRLSQIGAISRWMAPTIPTLTPIAVAEAALWVVCLEATLQLDGLGSFCLTSLLQGDIDFLMAICLGLGLLTGLAQVLADLVLSSTQVNQAEI